MSAIPLCFVTPRMFELWTRSDQEQPLAQRCDNPCRDCTPGYQIRMKRVRRCSHPETMFAFDEEGAVYGYWPK